MDFDEARKELLTAYESLEFRVVDPHARELLLQNDACRLRLCDADIEEYAALTEIRASLTQAPNACSVVSLKYREQLIRPLDTLRLSPMFMIRGAETYLFGSRDGFEPYLEIGPATPHFIQRLRFDADLVDHVTRRFRMRRPGEYADHSELFSRMITIRVHRLDAKSLAQATEASDRLIDAAFFELSYLKGIAVGTVEAWPNMRVRGHRRHFRHGEIHHGRALPLPRTSFNPDILRFYQLGTSTDVPVLQFLSFYQVLEYFFISVSDAHLYDRLRTRLNDPRFRATASHLDRLVQDVLDHNRATDETEMLRAVLTKFVTEQEVIEFIRAYEEFLKEPYYSKKRTRFGVDIEVRLQEGHVLGNVAKVFKAVRNALVHSADRHERAERHVPFSKGTEIVEKEVPLVRFLAERVVIASAS